MKRIDHAHSCSCRIEHLLMVAQRLRLELYEVERAIDELVDGCPSSHTATVEARVAAWMGGAA